MHEVCKFSSLIEALKIGIFRRSNFFEKNFFSTHACSAILLASVCRWQSLTHCLYGRLTGFVIKTWIIARVIFISVVSQRLVLTAYKDVVISFWAIMPCTLIFALVCKNTWITMLPLFLCQNVSEDDLVFLLLNTNLLGSACPDLLEGNM